MEKSPPLVKITPPAPSGVLLRERLLDLIDAGIKRPVVWVSGPAGSGKTTLVANYIKERKIPCLWYQVDEGDADISTFFYYMGLAAKKAAPGYKKTLPLLTPEYLQGIPAFTRRYFEELFKRLASLRSPRGAITPPSPFYPKRGKRGAEGRYPAKGMGGVLVVLDNYQDVPSDSGFHEMINNGMDAIPEGINVVVLSRSEPPSRLVRLRANNKLSLLGWNDLSFTLEECRVFLKSKDGSALPEEEVKRLHDKTNGWAAGLMLITEMAKTKEIQYPLISELSHEAVFNYFANEIFDKTDTETRDFLLKTSFLNAIDAEIAEKLTGNTRARAILSALNRNNYFTNRQIRPEPIYQYHPLFRDFLKARAITVFSSGELNRVRRGAAALIETTGQIEEAVELYSEAGDVKGLARLIVTHAPGLVSQGRFRIVGGWLDKIPADRLDSDPWLLYWQGVCKLLSGVLSEGRTCFEKAFDLFNMNMDKGGALLCWSGVVESIIYAWDDFRPLDKWIEWLEEHLKEMPIEETVPGAKAAACMVMALYFRKFHDPEIETWMDRALSLARKTGDVNMLMQANLNAVWYLLFTDVPRCRVMLDQAGNMVKLSGSPFMKVNLKGLEAVIHSSFPEWGDDAIGEILEAMELSGKEGFHFYDHVLLPQAAFAFLNRGETARMPELLEKIKLAIPPNMRNLRACYHMLVGWERLIAGDVRLAVAHAQSSLENSVESGSPGAEALSHILLAQALHEAGDGERSLRHLGFVRRMCHGSNNSLLLYLSLLMEALFALDRADEKRGLQVLSKAMSLGNNSGLNTILFWWNRRGMARLCSTAIEAGIAEAHAKNLIKTLGLVPERPVENWPYPIRVYTLGIFEILIDDRPVQFSGKVQKKPLDMLKALIALGGEHISEGRLSDALWPDAEGDSAHKSFEMTLLRLRRLLGRDDLVSLQGGVLSLDPRYCWVDAQVFERLYLSAQEAWREMGANKSRDRTSEAVRLSEKAIGIYKGMFLPNDIGLDCTAMMREKMRNRALQLVSSLGDHWEKNRQWEKAVEYHRRGLDIDKLSEEFYRHLMVCCEKLGQRAEAVRVYEQCKSALSSSLGIDPSGETEALHRRIRGKHR